MQYLRRGIKAITHWVQLANDINTSHSHLMAEEYHLINTTLILGYFRILHPSTGCLKSREQGCIKCFCAWEHIKLSYAKLYIFISRMHNTVCFLDNMPASSFSVPGNMFPHFNTLCTPETYMFVCLQVDSKQWSHWCVLRKLDCTNCFGDQPVVRTMENV